MVHPSASKQEVVWNISRLTQLIVPLMAAKSLPFIMAVLIKAMKMPKFKKCFKITYRLQKPGKIRDHYKMEI